MGFLRKRAPDAKLVEEANAAFLRFDPEHPTMDAQFTDVLARVYASISLGELDVAQLEAIAAPLQTMPPMAAVMCAWQVLHSSGRLLVESDGAGGEPLAWMIAAAGVGAAWKVVPTARHEHDCRNLIAALDVLWRYEPPGYREIDHAQAVYVSGHLALRLGYDRDALASRFREALRLLAEVDPERAEKASARDQIARTKEHLERNWREQLAAIAPAD